MEQITVNNVHQALPEGCRLILEKGRVRGSRNGPVLVLPTPLATTYLQPAQRVLFWPERDANPFFHLMEALWMLGGRRDVEWIGKFNSKLVQYSDDGVVYNGAYGWRWRSWFGIDQLKTIIRNLKRNPECRRQVLTMWDGGRDLAQQDTKDVPCNLVVPVQIGVDGKLNLVVYNRSNDLIWGALGANAVQFSILAEVLAACIGVPFGTYTQVSANTHIYEPHWPMAKALTAEAADLIRGGYLTQWDPYGWNEVHPYPLVSDPEAFWQDLDVFLFGASIGFHNRFFTEVAAPIRAAWEVYQDKKGEPDRIPSALQVLEACKATDWKRACREWLLRRTPNP